MAVEISSLSDGVIPLCELPEGYIANTLSLTSPRDACRLSLVASIFRFAAESDDVWERFLPPDYRDILGRSAEGVKLLRSPMSRKELFLHLCDNPILIDGGTKSFSLEKSSGKKCYMLSARDMTIVWSDTPTYWEWITLPESRFSSVADLIMVCWFEICSTIKTSMLSPHTTYAFYLVFKVKSASYGFGQPPAEASVGFSGQEGEKKAVHLDPYGEGSRRGRVGRRRLFNFRHPRMMGLGPPGVVGQQETDDVTHVQHAKQRDDRWMEVELGEIFIDGVEDADLEISLMEIKGGHWKGGLVIEGIEIRPKKGN